MAQAPPFAGPDINAAGAVAKARWPRRQALHVVERGLRRNGRGNVLDGGCSCMRARTGRIVGGIWIAPAGGSHRDWSGGPQCGGRFTWRVRFVSSVLVARFARAGCHGNGGSGLADRDRWILRQHCYSAHIQRVDPSSVHCRRGAALLKQHS